MLSLLFGAVVFVVVTAAAVIAVVGVEAWSVRVAVRTRLACELERVRQTAALEEVGRHRARIARELDALIQDPALAVEAGASGALELPVGGDRGAAV